MYYILNLYAKYILKTYTFILQHIGGQLAWLDVVYMAGDLQDERH